MEADIKARLDEGKANGNVKPVIGFETKVDEFAAAGVVYDQDGVKVTAFDVNHGDEIKPAVGYRIDYKGRSVLISGDTRKNDNVVKYGRGVDVLVPEAAVNEAWTQPGGTIEIQRPQSAQDDVALGHSPIPATRRCGARRREG